MANIDFGRLAVLGIVILLVQQFLGSIVVGLLPAVTGFSVAGFTVGGVITVGAGLWAGEAIYGMIKKR